MIAALAFYLFAGIVVRLGAGGRSCARNPVHSRAVADPRVLQCGRAVRAARRRVPRDDPGDRLCRRGRGAVPVRRDDARHRFRRAASRVRAAICRSALLLAVVLAGELLLVRRRAGRSASACRARHAPAPAAMPNTQALGHADLHALFFIFEGAGMVLLTAMIGAIVLTHRQRTGVRRQNMARRPRGPPRTRSRHASRRAARA